MVGDLGLGLAEPAGQLSGRQLALGLQQLEDPQAGGVPERPEVLGHQVAPGWSLGEAKWRELRHKDAPLQKLVISVTPKVTGVKEPDHACRPVDPQRTSASTPRSSPVSTDTFGW